jgi:hypothetical protein
MNKSAYDDWKLNGRWSRCECGAQWSESDGGPCHFRCSVCKQIVDACSDNYGICPDCAAERDENIPDEFESETETEADND